MKTKLTIVIILLFGIKVNLKAQQQVIKYPGYISYWNPKTLIPDSVIWTCSPHKKVADREPEFHSTGGRPNLTKDYSHSGFDIGHNCDASDENGDKTDEYNSFDFANTFPQRPNLNRRVWLALEEQTRKLGVVKVKVSWRDTLGYIGPDKVLVPKICIKDIWYNGKHERYEMPNTDDANKFPYTHYLVK